MQRPSVTTNSPTPILHDKIPSHLPMSAPYPLSWATLAHLKPLQTTIEQCPLEEVDSRGREYGASLLVNGKGGDGAAVPYVGVLGFLEDMLLLRGRVERNALQMVNGLGGRWEVFFGAAVDEVSVVCLYRLAVIRV